MSGQAQPPAVATRRETSGIAAAVAALPALPASDTADRYGAPALTVAWLAGFSPHTRIAYFRDLAHFLAWCQRDGLDPLTARPADIGRYRAAVEAPAPSRIPPSPATVHRRLSALSSWYRYLVANSGGLVAANPLLGARRPTVDRDASATVGLTGEEVRALLRCADAAVAGRERDLAQGATPHRVAGHLAALRDRALVRLLAELGLRIGEALVLEVASLSHNRGRRTRQHLTRQVGEAERDAGEGNGMAVDLVYETHATSVDNEAGIATGWLPGELSETGRRQARALGERHRDRGVAAVFTSDLRRAVQTARIAFDATGIPVHQDARLRECNYGALNGASTGVVSGERLRRIDEPYPGGESYQQVVERTRELLADLVRDHDGERVVVIAHSANRWALDVLVHGVPLEEAIEARFTWQPGWHYLIGPNSRHASA